MKRICFGTVITLLYQSRMRCADRIKNVCSGIFAAFGLDINNFNQGLPSHLKSGHDPVSGVLVDAARNLSIEDIDRGVLFYFCGKKDDVAVPNLDTALNLKRVPVYRFIILSLICSACCFR